MNDVPRYRVAALAGRRIDPEGAVEPRFPLAQVGAVRAQVHAMWERIGVEHVVASAACGADLIGLEAASDIRPRVHRHVVLPFSPDRFLRSSVIDRPGDWQAAFERVMSDPETHLLVVDSDAADDIAYALTNERILQQALRLAAGETPLAVVIWDEKVRSEGDATGAFRTRAKELAFDICDLRSLPA